MCISFMTRAQIAKQCKYWQRRLGLREWSITVEIVSKTNMPKVLGTCRWSTEETSALIELREDADESTLVHELLHLVIDGHKVYKRYSPPTERAINRIAAALLKA